MMNWSDSEVLLPAIRPLNTEDVQSLCFF